MKTTIWRLIILSSLSLSLYSAPSMALSLDEKGHLQLHGYLQRIGQSEINDKQVKFQNRLLGDYTEAGLSALWQLNTTTQATGEIHYQTLSPEKENATLNILSITHEFYHAPWGYLSIGAGRLKNTLIGLNCAQDAPLLRETTSYARVYLGNMTQAFYSLDGIRLNTQWNNTSGDLINASWYLGKMQSDNFGKPQLSPNIQIEMKDYRLNGFKLKWEPAQAPGLLVGGSYAVSDSTNQLHINQGPFNTTLPNQTTAQISTLMARYEWQNWRLSSEYAHVSLDFNSGQSIKETLPSFYLSLVWQPLIPWSATLRYEATQTSNLSAQLTPTPPNSPPSSTTSYKMREGWIIYLRHQLTPHTFLGMELDWLHDKRRQTENTVALGQIGASF